jgi:cytoplasmic iron level regulating protein YaaA (DUF328/UPF0246 family)
MLLLLSPAKTLDFETPVAEALLARARKPAFVPRSQALVGLLRDLPAQGIGELMGISPALADLNAQRFKAWSSRFGPHNSKPALLAFAGDVYDGLQAGTMSEADIDWAERHLRILSGLYGVLKPLDWLQPYRLEMGTRLANPSGRDLYAFWGDTLAEHLNKELKADASPVIVNLASQEYFKAVDRPLLKARVVECVFEDWKDGRYKLISFFAKKARGLMARWAIEHRVMTPQALTGFDREGYAHAPEASTAQRLVFRRRLAD